MRKTGTLLTHVRDYNALDVNGKPP